MHFAAIIIRTVKITTAIIIIIVTSAKFGEINESIIIWTVKRFQGGGRMLVDGHEQREIYILGIYICTISRFTDSSCSFSGSRRGGGGKLPVAYIYIYIGVFGRGSLKAHYRLARANYILLYSSTRMRTARGSLNANKSCQ